MTVNEKILFDALKQSLGLIRDILEAPDAAKYIAANLDYIDIVRSDSNDALATIDPSLASTCQGDSCKFSL
ncbi:MAG: hypothetical protein NTY51_13120 [Deltaproteobacteria bacterium]|nr:hypothetical protein [Deltaproteobacteria bacterium]